MWLDLVCEFQHKGWVAYPEVAYLPRASIPTHSPGWYIHILCSLPSLVEAVCAKT